ncbi:MAG: DUF6396 domain-containing protein [Betaproteobacteria bacterium]|nr:DUF6396 domain-containing protein [Betaproteobacteria bacterium]
MPADFTKSPAQIEDQLAFTCAHEKDRIPKRDPDADNLFEHANWRYKKNLLKEDPAVYPEIERLYRIATAWGHDKAANNLVDMILSGRTGQGDRITKPVDIAEDLIARGIPHGHYIMGVLLNKGYGAKRDPDAALQHFRKAADLGDPQAQFYVGDKLTQLTIDRPIPYKIGKQMKRCAADHGHAQAAIDTALDLMDDSKTYAEAVKYFQISVKAGGGAGASFLEGAFNGPLPDNRLYYMGQDKDEERATRYKKIRKTLDGYDYAGIRVDEIDEIVPLPPAKLPPWDGEIAWVKKWNKDEAPPLPDAMRIAEMALEKSLNPATGLPVKLDLRAGMMRDPATDERISPDDATSRVLAKMRDEAWRKK